MTTSLALVAALSLASSPALPVRLLAEATTAQVPPDAPYELRYSLPVDGAIAGTAAILWLGSEYLFKRSLAPRECRILCERSSDGVSTVNSWDLQARAVRWENVKAAALASDIMVYAALPATVAALQYYNASASNAAGGVWVDYLLILEAAAVAQVVNQTVKFLVGRERPYANARTLEERLELYGEDDNLSFFSGHATFALALTTAAATVSSLRGYKHAWLVWAIAVPLAATVPYFRMAADKHYLSDVVIGSLVGAAFGIGLPLLHGRATNDAGSPQAARMSFGAFPGGITFGGTF